MSNRTRDLTHRQVVVLVVLALIVFRIGWALGEHLWTR
jgi:hypothetical protein